MSTITDIREERPADLPAIWNVNQRAFGRPDEASVIDKLRARLGEQEDAWLSLVAERDGQVVGHVLFTPVRLEIDSGGELGGMGLAPLAVLPEYQKQGVGSALTRYGLEILRQRNCPYVVVLGHPKYYPRFGFRPATSSGIRCQWEGVPDEAFMALVFDETILQGVSGVVYYCEEFDEVT